MAHLELNNNDPEMNGYDSEHNQNLHIPPNNEPTRAPQLNAAVTGHGGASSGRQNISDGGDSDSESDSADDGDCDAVRQGVYLIDGNASDDEDGAINDGQEGVEDIQRDPSQPGTPGCPQGCPCRCHVGNRRGRDPLLSFSPPACSGVHTPSSSVMAVRDSAGSSMESSVLWPPPSPVPSERNYWIPVHDTFFQPNPLVRFSLVYDPLPLSPESTFAYPRTIELVDDDDEY